MLKYKTLILLAAVIGLWFASDSSFRIASPEGPEEIEILKVSEYAARQAAEANSDSDRSTEIFGPIEPGQIVVTLDEAVNQDEQEQIAEIPAPLVVSEELESNDGNLNLPPRMSKVETQPATEQLENKSRIAPFQLATLNEVKEKGSRTAIIPPFAAPNEAPQDVSDSIESILRSKSSEVGTPVPDLTETTPVPTEPAEIGSKTVEVSAAPQIETEVDTLTFKPQTEPEVNAETKPVETEEESKPVEEKVTEKESPIQGDQEFDSGTIDLSDGIAFKEDFKPWWIEEIVKPVRKSAVQKPIDLETLIFGAMLNAPKLQVLSSEPLLAESVTSEESARFDPSVFLETNWNDLNNPVGNRLTTGGPPFLEDHIWDYETGIRKLTQRGGQLQLSQELGFQNSNSNFFVPQDQGTARLALSFNQPLLNGAGKLVNRSQIVIAQLDQQVASEQYNRELQKYTNSIVRAYWDLYFERSILLQRHRNYQRALEIYRMLEGRADFDTVSSQLARTRAAVLARKIEVRVLQTKVLNAETRLRELVRDIEIGQLGDADSVELIPQQFPQVFYDDQDITATVGRSMENRPEIRQALNEIKKASREQKVAENDLLPILNLVLETYSAALDGGTGIERAFTQQFGKSKISYSAGFIMEYPLRNRAAYARLQRSEVQVQKLSQQLEDVVGKVIADVEIARREAETAYVNFKNTIASVQSANADVRYIRERWENFAFVENVDIATPNTLLEQLLDAQQRQSDAEVAFSTAVRNHMNAQANLKLADGTILQQHEVFPVPAQQANPSQPYQEEKGTEDETPSETGEGKPESESKE